MTTQKLNVTYPSRREPAGTVEVGVTINGNEYFAYMAPGACNLRTFYGLNNITKNEADPSHILAAIVLSGIGGSIMVFTDAYGRGADAQKLKEYVESQDALVKGGCAVTIANGSGNPYMGGGKVVGAILDYQMPVLKAWYDATFGAAEADGWVAHQRVNMDSIFYQYGGRPHEKNGRDKTFHAYLDETLAKSRTALEAVKAGF